MTDAPEPCSNPLDAVENRRALDLARYARDVQARTGRAPAGANGPGSPSTLLASEQRRYDAKLADVRALDAMRAEHRKGKSPTDLLRQLESPSARAVDMPLVPAPPHTSTSLDAAEALARLAAAIRN